MAGALERILIADDNPARTDAVRQALAALDRPVEIRVARTLSAYREIAGSCAPDAALVSLELAGGWSGQALTSPPEFGPFPVVALADAGHEDEAAGSLAAGALDYLIASPAGLAQAAHVLRRARYIWELLRDRQRAEEQIRLLTELLDVAPASITVHDAQGRFLYANQRSFDLHGYTREEFLALNLHDLDAAASERLIEPRIQLLREIGQTSFEVEHLRKDGSVLPLHVHVRAGQWRDQAVFFSVALDISDRRRAEQALGESEKRFRSLIESSPMGFHLYRREASGRLVLVDANPAAGRILGIDHEPLFGRTVEEAFPNIAETEIPARFLEVASQGGTWQTTAIGYENGELAGAFEVYVFQTGPGAIAVMFLESTEKRIALERLHQSEERYRTLFETMAQGVVYQDRAGAIVAANPAAGRILGLHPDDLSGRSSLDPAWEPIEMDGSPLAADRQPPVISLATGRPAHGVFGVRSLADGIRRWVHVSSQPQMRPGESEPYQVFNTITDITDLKLAQDEVRRLNAELEARVRDRTAELEAAVRELEAFSYSVSHDLRAPLRAINGFAHILMEDFADRLPAEARGHLQVVHRNARTMGELIDGLLAFSRLGRADLLHRPVDCHATVRAVLEEFEPELRGRPIEIRIGELPPCEGDPLLLKQVWANLLSNALKFTHARAAPVVEIGGHEEDGRRIYFVRDNGAGFDMRHAGKLFGVFERLHSSGEFEGTGVGLAIVKRIVERHGGTVWAEGSVGQGATFSFALPGPAHSKT